MKYLVQVSTKDIQEGIKESCLFCPVAIAVNRAMKKTENLFSRAWLVGSNDLTFQGKKYSLPKAAVNAIADFDNGRLVAPFSFEIEINE